MDYLRRFRGLEVILFKALKSHNKLFRDIIKRFLYFLFVARTPSPFNNSQRQSVERLAPTRPMVAMEAS